MTEAAAERPEAALAALAKQARAGGAERYHAKAREQGTLPHPNATPHDYAAYVASDRRPTAAELETMLREYYEVRGWEYPAG